jgi:hypothetical protein
MFSFPILKEKPMNLLRTVLLFVCVLAIALSGSQSVQAQTYPTTNPGFTPNAVGSQQTFAAAGDLFFNCNGVAGYTISVQGTFTGLAATVRVTNDVPYPLSASNTWTGVSVTAISSPPQAAISSLSATGLYRGNCQGLTGLNVHVTAVSTGSAKIRVVANANPWSVHAVFNSGDPCADPNMAKSVAIINIGTATTTKIVDTSASTVVYVCSFQMAVSGSTPTFVFKTGTHASADCDTAAANLSGTYSVSSGIQLSYAPGNTIMKSIAGGQVCGTTTGSGGGAQGLLSYVQQ